MPRVSRFACAGVPHHVTQRGNRRGRVFFAAADYDFYLHLLQEYSTRHQLEVLAYCLMSNHVHLVVVPATAIALEQTLRPLHMRHAQRVNRARNWKGHLWQGRYFSSALDSAYFWAAIRYVERNPVRAGMVAAAEDYVWSSARAHCGMRSDPVLSKKPQWKMQFQGIADWSAWVAACDQPATLGMLRRNVGKGLPCGSDEFIDGLERQSGRQLHFRPQGGQTKRRPESEAQLPSAQLGLETMDLVNEPSEPASKRRQVVLDVRRNLGKCVALE